MASLAPSCAEAAPFLSHEHSDAVASSAVHSPEPRGPTVSAASQTLPAPPPPSPCIRSLPPDPTPRSSETNVTVYGMPVASPHVEAADSSLNLPPSFAYFPILLPPSSSPSGPHPIRVTRSHGCLEVDIPAVGVFSGGSSLFSLFLVFHAIICLCLVPLFNWLALTTPIFSLAILPYAFAGSSLLSYAMRGLFLRERVIVGPDTILIQRAILCWSRRVCVSRGAVSRVELKVEEYKKGAVVTRCRLVEGVMEHEFGVSLRTREQQWLLSVLARELDTPLSMGIAPQATPVVPAPCDV